jgi:hypothetical protein
MTEKYLLRMEHISKFYDKALNTSSIEYKH